MGSDKFLYNTSWNQRWPITRDVIYKVISQDKIMSISSKELNLIREFVLGFSKKILHTQIPAPPDDEQLKNIAINLYYYNLFLIETEKCKTSEELVQCFTLENDFIARAIHNLNPYITKSYFILLMNMLSDYINKDKSVTKRTFLTALALFKEALQRMIAALSPEQVSNYWVILLSMTSYIASYIYFEHLENPNKSEGAYFLNVAKTTIKLILPDNKNKDFERSHNINYLTLCQELKLDSVHSLEALIFDFAQMVSDTKSF